MNRFVQGFRMLVGGMRAAFSKKEMIRTVLPPVFINLLIFLILGYVLIHFFGGWVLVELGAAWYAVALSILISVLIAAVLVFVFAAVFAALTSVIGAPFYDALADAHMKRSGDIVRRSFMQDVVHSIKNEAKKIFVFGGVQLLLLLLPLIPGIGTVAYTILGFLFTIFFLSYSYLDYAFSRTTLGFRERLAWIRKRRLEAAGFGLAVFLSLLVPVLNAFMIPSAVVGAVMLYRKFEQEKQ